MPQPIRPHPDHHDLHGFTIAVDTGDELYVGRCHDMDESRIRLVDVAVQPYTDRVARRRWLEQVVRFGHWKQHDRLVVARDRVVWFDTIGRLADQGLPPD